VAQFGGFFAYSFVLPFSALYLDADLGVHNPSQLALWTGAALAANGFAMALTTPIWGILGDRFGRKQMVVRSMLGGAVAVFLMGIVQTPLQLVGTRLLLGAFAGISAATAALVVAETPRDKVATALGYLGSSLAVGRTVGPLVGGALAAIFTLRQVFFGGGLLLAIATLIVVFFASESARSHAERRGSMASVRALDRSSRRAIVALVAAQGLIQWTFSSAQGLLALRVLALDTRHATLVTGLAVAVAGLCTVAAGATYSRPLGRVGYRVLAGGAAVLLFAATALLGFAPSDTFLILAMAAVGIAFGILSPSLSAMLGLEAPAEAKATVLSFGATSFALGLAVGPLVTGLVAGTLGIGPGLLSAGAVGLVAAGLLFAWGREPVTAHAAGATTGASA
jgi:MFS transporter, DHA1 family, multidrug resistance protein